MLRTIIQDYVSLGLQQAMGQRPSVKGLWPSNNDVL
jgi:hypothetical protein